MRYTQFTEDGEFIVPDYQTKVRVICIGGGGGGGYGLAGGAGSGLVASWEFRVESNRHYHVKVGSGGPGCTSASGCTSLIGGGGESRFGDFPSCKGGNSTKAHWPGGSGGSGGGSACNVNNPDIHGGPGGTNGAAGGECTDSGGRGQGDLSSIFQMFKYAQFSAGRGGAGGSSSHSGGGGGGGVLLFGSGPNGADGENHFSGKGGKGYGAGGGGGGYEMGNSKSWNGGNGADGFVYIEW